jgi:hypothetical protein
LKCSVLSPSLSSFCFSATLSIFLFPTVFIMALLCFS